LKLNGFIAAIVLVTAACAGVATAQQPDQLTMVWRIVPQEELEPAKLVKSNDVVARARLVPMSMVVTAVPATSSDGTQLLPEGSQLAVLQGVPLVACNTYVANRVEALGLPLGPPKNSYVCLIDRDADGSFESVTSLKSLVMTAFVGTFKPPKPKAAIRPTAYRIGDPAEWRGKEFAEFRYLGKTMSGTYRFGMTPRREGDNNVVFLHVRADQKFGADELPGRFSAFGAQFEILGLEDGKPRIKAVTPFSNSPFFILGYGVSG
jgi:hypothetical protein